MTSLTLRAVNQKRTQSVSLKRFIDGHGHNKDTLGNEQCVEKTFESREKMVAICILAMFTSDVTLPCIAE